MQFTGFADEASRDLAIQIAAARELGWNAISLRMIGDQNVHELPQAEFDTAAAQLEQAGIAVPEFGSLIGNWGKRIDGDFAVTVAEIERAIPRMQRLGTKFVRIMSYAQQPWGEDQRETERFRRLREIVVRFADAGLVALHENCMNWGGFSPAHSLRLIEEVPGLRLIFDTANPVFAPDRSKPQADGGFPWQDPWEFWVAVRDFVDHIHLKDCRHPVAAGVEPEFVVAGEGQGCIRRILADAKARGYAGWLAIEPHVATIFHATAGEQPDWDEARRRYVGYGRAVEQLVAEL